MPPSYWAEALSTACSLLKRRPSSSINSEVPHTHLYRVPPTYDHLRVFGCLCYPNLQATSPHKLDPHAGDQRMSPPSPPTTAPSCLVTACRLGCLNRPCWPRGLHRRLPLPSCRRVPSHPD
jgi:hypothetical protein